MSATAAYSAGYITWALIAWLNKLPQLPLLDTQYLTAGVLPLLFGAIVILSGRAAVKFVLNWWPSYVESLSPRVQLLLLGLLVATACIGGLLFGSVTARATLQMPHSAWFKMATYLICLTALLLLPSLVVSQSLLTWAALRLRPHASLSRVTLLRRSMQPAIALDRRLKQTMLYLLPALFAFVLFVTYIRTWYTQVPQALGGARARVAALDLSTSDVSSQTLHDLGVMPHPPLPPVVRTGAVRIVFAGGTTIIVSLTPVGPGEPRTVELPRASVKALAWQE